MLAFIFGFYGRIVGFMCSIEIYIYIEISWIYMYTFGICFGIRFVISLQLEWQCLSVELLKGIVGREDDVFHSLIFMMKIRLWKIMAHTWQEFMACFVQD